MPDIGVVCDEPLSSGHLMKTEAHLRASDGLLLGLTRTRSVVLLGGFHGAVQAFVAGEGGEIIAKSGKQTYGVDGVLIGRHDRTDTWSESLGADVGSRAREIAIVHSWDPQWLSAVTNTIRFLTDLFTTINDAGKGTVRQGAAMGWPRTAPWTQPPVRRQRARRGRIDRADLQRPSPMMAGVGGADTADAVAAVSSIDDPLWGPGDNR
jgi:hypothetical protein